MADPRKPFDPETIQQGLESLFGRASEFISRGREEILKQSKIGKVKLFDLTQLRRERARLVSRLGEEAYRGMQSGSLDRDDLERTYKRVVAMDEQIAAKEAEIEVLKRAAEGGANAKGATGTTGAKKAAARTPSDGAAARPKAGKTPPTKTKPPMDTKSKRSMASDDDEEDEETDDESDE